MITVRHLGVTDYAATLARMREHVARRAAERDDASADELWLTSHPPVFTLGFASRSGHLHNPGEIAVIETERGGQVTYHGPGQVVAYTLLNLRRRKLGVRELVSRLEAGIMRCLAGYGIVGVRRAGAPGIYVGEGVPAGGTTDPVAVAMADSMSLPRTSGRSDGTTGAATQARAPAKIASIGLKVSRGFTWHGIALNGLMDLEPFTRIDPCGYPGQIMTDVASEAGDHFPVELEDLARRLGSSLVQAIESGE